MSQKMKIKAMLALVILVVSFSVIKSTLAWLGGFNDQEIDVNGSIRMSYFESGKGTEEEPYIIHTPTHLNNLAWLQAVGMFDDKAYYFKVCDHGDSCVMDASSASLTDDVNLKIPPIGTTEYPFKGYFDGNGQTISAVTVTADDWSNKPDENVFPQNWNVGKDFGFFGVVDGGAVSKFYLENITVKPSNNSTTGLIAGRVEGDLSQVGVCGGKFELQAGITVQSDYSLVGETDKVIWKDMPTKEGIGDLVIYPPNMNYGITGSSPQVFSTVERNQIRDIVTSPLDENGNYTAKFVGLDTAVGTTNPLPSRVVTLYENTTDKNGNTIKKVRQLNFNGKATTYELSNSTYMDMLSNGNFALQGINPNFAELFYKESTDPYSGAKSVSFNTAAPTMAISPGRLTNKKQDAQLGPNFTNLLKISGDEKGYPQNVVWFQPLTTGECVITFTIQDNSAAAHVSLYRYKRKSDLTIDTSNMQQINLILRPIGNGTVAYFEIPIEEEDLDYEYCIGRTDGSSNNPVLFSYLVLGAGDVGHHDEETSVGTIEKIDYVSNIPSTPNICTADTYTPYRVLYEVSGTAAGNETITYSATGTPEAGTVITTVSPDTGSVVPNNILGTGPSGPTANMMALQAGPTMQALPAEPTMQEISAYVQETALFGQKDVSIYTPDKLKDVLSSAKVYSENVVLSQPIMAELSSVMNHSIYEMSIASVPIIYIRNDESAMQNAELEIVYSSEEGVGLAFDLGDGNVISVDNLAEAQSVGENHYKVTIPITVESADLASYCRIDANGVIADMGRLSSTDENIFVLIPTAQGGEISLERISLIGADIPLGMIEYRLLDGTVAEACLYIDYMQEPNQSTDIQIVHTVNGYLVVSKEKDRLAIESTVPYELADQMPIIEEPGDNDESIDIVESTDDIEKMYFEQCKQLKENQERLAEAEMLEKIESDPNVDEGENTEVFLNVEEGVVEEVEEVEEVDESEETIESEET